MLKKILENGYSYSIFWTILASEAFFPQGYNVTAVHCWWPREEGLWSLLSSQHRTLPPDWYREM